MTRTHIKTKPKPVFKPLKKSESASKGVNKELDTNVHNNICDTRALQVKSGCDYKRAKFWQLCNF